jgi:hypothetical protein
MTTAVQGRGEVRMQATQEPVGNLQGRKVRPEGRKEDGCTLGCCLFILLGFVVGWMIAGALKR